MKSQELRQAWIDFFVGKQHKLLAPATLVPHEMSTTLFTIAGMEQFVPVFLGEQPAPAPRVVTVQRCLRVAGAKSDIESVGRTGRHGTFLEMLGNFSFGDYYKREAIAWAWEFMTEVLKLDPRRLYVTVHTGDDEAERIWVGEIGLDPARVTRFHEENFWTMGATGPCGPCTEIFYDTGAEHASGPDDIGPNLGNRYVEVWNIVFQQYNRGADGQLADLPRKAIDTGAGLERMLAVCNGVASMYDTDLFTDIVAAQPPVGRTSLSPEEQPARRNIIADHLRAATFLINDGVYPSNTDRGFVLRFLVRRAIRNGRLLGYPNGFLAALVPAVVRSLEPGYPELRESTSRIASALRLEEQTFDRTLERGMAMLDRVIEETLARGEHVIGGGEAFLLHDTYGFPLELTREIAAERGTVVDAVGFDRLMAEQRERARQDAAAKRDVVEVSDLPALRSEFTGYDEGLESDGEVVALLRGGASAESLRSGEEGTVVLSRTSFYAERGGQIGDRGTIECSGPNVARFEVRDTQYMGEAIAHQGVVLEGELAVGERVRTSVSERWRREIRRHHTSAHLLQRALKDVLGEEVNQAGSWVGIDRMRFDFRWPGGALTQAQKRDVAHRVNAMIRDDSHLVTRVLPPDEAKKTGAIWMAGEKYGDMIRVVQAGPSIEFCGGTHSHTTGELGMFVILSEFSIGSGIRRIESCVSDAAEEYVAKQSDLIGTLASTLAAAPDELSERVERMQRDVKELQTALGQLRAKLAAAEAAAYVERAQRSGDRAFVGAVVPEADGEALRHLSNAIRARLRSGVVALAGIDDGRVSLLVSASDDLVKAGVHAGNLVKLAAPLVSGKGGGQAAVAQGGGTDAGGAEAALQAIRDAVFA
ncbi:MAG: alanine--tRNA ligase [Candidatus Eremiobacteraeota bacterium]|nr:alanine--tRNA ligase [Candidatus Eremiobacteraeota bacterium]MBV8499839.1 alanine--tRNA ligase [Candidatus Eremiobacteraeota bacterium]